MKKLIYHEADEVGYYTTESTVPRLLTAAVATIFALVVAGIVYLEQGEVINNWIDSFGV